MMTMNTMIMINTKYIWGQNCSQLSASWIAAAAVAAEDNDDGYDDDDDEYHDDDEYDDYNK